MEASAIKVAQLTESEKKLLNSVGVGRYFVFDLDPKEMNIQRLEYRVDYYEKGKLVEHLIDSSTSVDSLEKGKQRLVWSQIETGSNKDEVWTINFTDSRITQKVTFPEQIRGMSWSQNELVSTVNPGEEVMLAAIVGTESGEIRNPEVIFDIEEGGIQSLVQYDIAYVLTLIFH